MPSLPREEFPSSTDLPRRPLRVLALGPLPPPYHGVATFLRDLLQTPAAGIEFRHLDTSDRRDAANLGRWDAENIRLGVNNVAELAQRCARQPIDLVYLPLSQSSGGFLRDALFILQARLAGKRVVAHLHGGYFRILYDSNTNPAFRAIARQALQSCSAVLVLAEEFRPIFKALVQPERIFVVENGVADHALPQVGGDAPVVLFMSTLTRTKGILELLRALALLRRKFPQVRLRVAGRWADEDLQHEAEKIIASEQLGDAVEFVGNIDGADKARFLASGTLFCLPTFYPYEGQPLVLLEAMAAALPIVATRHAAIPSTLADCGELVGADVTPEALCGAMEQLLNDPARRADLGRRARTRYLERYTLAACHERLAKVLLQAADL